MGELLGDVPARSARKEVSDWRIGLERRARRGWKESEYIIASNTFGFSFRELFFGGGHDPIVPKVALPPLAAGMPQAPRSRARRGGETTNLLMLG